MGFFDNLFKTTQTDSSIAREQMNQFLQDYEEITTTTVPTLGKVTVYKKNEGSQGTVEESDFLVHGRKFFDSEYEAQDYLADVKLARGIAHPNILDIVWSSCTFPFILIFF